MQEVTRLEPTDPRIDAILEAILESGEAAERACRDAPELLSEVNARLARVMELESHLDQILPEGRGISRKFAPVGGKLPEIAGYRTERILGCGGMGVVYLARHLKLNRQVAIKMLLAGGYASPRELERFRREAESIAALCHPNIVQVFDAGECDGHPFFVMEYMSGGTLAHRLAGQPQTSIEAAESIQRLAGAVQMAHAAGIVHRDLKPANILLAPDGTMKIADFGLAGRAGIAASGALSIAGRLGTPSYMAPEQAGGTAPSFCPLADVYGLGAILYEMLTGRPPFRAENPSETQRQVIHDEPVPPERLNPGVPRDLQTICLKCLQKDPARRYPSAADLAHDLDRFRRGVPIQGRPVGVLERGLKWVRRRPAQASLIGVVMLALVGATAAGVWVSSKRAAVRSAALADIADAETQQQAGAFEATQRALDRARARLGSSIPDGLLARLQSVQRTLDMVEGLAALRMKRAGSRESRFDRRHYWELYRKHFVDAGLLRAGDTPMAFATRVRSSPVRSTLVDAMDDWASCATDKGEVQWLLGATRLADPDPSWRDCARDVGIWEDREALLKLAREADVSREPIPLLLILAGLLDKEHDASLELLKRVQLAHPADFWANFTLAESLGQRQSPDAIRFYQVAISLRPDAVAPYINIGQSLRALGHTKEALLYWNRALEVDPRSVIAHESLAIHYLDAGQLDQCVTHCRAALAIDEGSVKLHSIAGSALLAQGQFAQAAASFRRGLESADRQSPYHQEMLKELAKCEHFLSLQEKLPAVLSGSVPVTSPAEALEFAALCMRIKQYKSACRLYSDLFARFPKLERAVRVGASYDAACAAALASQVGSDAAGSIAGDPAKYRAMARIWLSQSLAIVSSELAETTPDRRGLYIQLLEHARSDPDLKAIRDPEDLASLAEEERGQSEEIWSGVRALLDRPDVLSKH